MPRQRAIKATKTPVQPPLAVVVLAAGAGKRMRSDLPKVLHPLAGQALLLHVLATARQLQPRALVVVHGHGGTEVQRVAAAHAHGSAVLWAKQAQQLGTGHAVAQALPQLPDDVRVLVLYGDVPLLRPETLRRLSEQSPVDGVGVLTARVADPGGYGRIVRDARGGVRRIVEDKDASARERRINEINTGVMLVPVRHLRQWLPQLKTSNAQGEYFLTDIVALAVRQKLKVRAVEIADADEVLGINDKRQLAQAEAIYRRRRADELLLAGATLVDPARIDIRGEVTVGRDVSIDVNVVLEGPVHLADGVSIGAHSVLSRVTLGSATQVQPFSLLQDAVVGTNCRIGPYARLRPGARLGDDVHVGNFVEVKNSSVGQGSKVNHLSYVGDATIGSRVNVGAGTVTCNYDGINKSETIIGDEAFIGSGTMLVAPVSVGEGATIGAGSTITRPAPAGKLTLERSRQLTIEGWRRPVRNPKPDPKS